MTEPEIILGLDLDNTLVCYDDLFHAAACEERLIEPTLPRSKEKVRNAIRLLPGGEARWTRLQALVYGPRMSGATMFDGCADFLRQCAAARVRRVIVSHRTPFAILDDLQVDLRRAALEWLEGRGFFSDFAFSRDDVFLESSRAEKVERIRALRCTHFIDDLPEVFAGNTFPAETARLLFAPHGVDVPGPNVRAFAGWREIERFFFHDNRS